MAETPKRPRRYDGKPIALALGAFLIVGTALSTYFAWQAELRRQSAHPAGAAQSATP